MLTGALVDLRQRNPGFSGSSVAVAQLVNRPGGYVDLDDAVYYRELTSQLAALPGVRSAVLAKPTPGLPSSEFLVPVRRLDAPGSPDTTASFVVASPGFFDALEVALLQGHDVAWSDTLNTPPVAVVSRGLADRLFPEGDAIGKRLSVGNEPRHQRLEIVGIAADASVLNIRTKQPPLVYVAWLQQPAPAARWPGLLLKVVGPPLEMEAATSRAVDLLGREFVTRYRPLDAQIDRSLARERLLSALSVFYGVLTVAMVALGLLALLSNDVTRRTREFAVRLALGASPRGLRVRIVLRGLRVTAIGLVVGVPAALGAMPALAAAVAVSGASGPAAVVAGCAALLIFGALAGAEPAWTASRVEPADALRSD